MFNPIGPGEICLDLSFFTGKTFSRDIHPTHRVPPPLPHLINSEDRKLVYSYQCMLECSYSVYVGVLFTDRKSGDHCTALHQSSDEVTPR